MATARVRVNHQIRAPELRVIGPHGENVGVIVLQEALSKASQLGLDLIEISPNAIPPVAKIMDYGKFQYFENKKQKAVRAKTHTVEVKNIQIKIGTSEHDLELKAKRVSEWLSEGNRVKIDLFLIGRSKYMEFKFLQERLERILKLIPVEYKVADSTKRGPKGLTIIVEKA
ncbi:MAG: translation initiation factor IF-3 [Candidatus Taylorbacteria bacterium RIFCSPHIGHO2_02_49_25]|uniref:Translation initiation factor IF-3 n=1 Tax=Candidatus Taylorbacteria bacterium RIFCSPHIGHO2_02_49_25 TaxID=1802305 RepID=A0A1G2ME86_9BACT|nr:MAG: Translation initiation factor IF-3 [Parcubacteria group bacterium GW2011_GWF2_50_9]OHA21361.1 MAG: translation initiation factor IF-3 [Candidatus Taylorbacteria bacterium RIFCSPHIGHO2_02_49_25]OHA21625.1 MAG: translation initiation factor IF-3 [Candidatus Taylorbacteria bacterium RIFCSPHIGHO2_01_FULL_49_60]OHA35425.1 MAG: translation initiation factor IF-3 [Candidatus Taylorbacteria bacterium RIFCSPLOWO2_02_50_13]OHA36960.1 MAG: translation initiation factor IF-3 [Candidatus Taylorbacte